MGAARRRDLALAWAVGVVVAVAVVGPGLGPGAWLNVDLVVTDVTPVPRGVWGIGPELPRRVPFALPFAWISHVAPGEWAWKAAVVVSLAAAVAGTWRLVGRWDPASSRWVRAGAGLIAGVGPFATTRLGVGHLGMVLALAALPWALPWLLEPLRSPRRTVWWTAVLALAGPFGGTVALPTLVCGLVGSRAWRAEHRRGGLRVLVGSIFVQAPWLVPTLVVAAAGTRISGAPEFATDAGGAGGVLRLLAGHGFWRPLSQVGQAGGWEVPLVGVVLAAGAVAGARRLPAGPRTSVALVAAVGLLVPAASALPVGEALVDALVALPGGEALREGQRLLALWVAVAAPLAAVGAADLGRRLGGAAEAPIVVAPLVVALVGLVPALWGVGGTLDPVTIPAGWDEARDAVRSDPGPVLVVPWAAYPPLAVTGGRPVLQPMPVFLGADVVTSSDPGFGDDRVERADPREERAEPLAEALWRGDDVTEELIGLGIRWVVEVPVRDIPVGRVSPTAGLEAVVATDDIALHRVDGWAPARRTDRTPTSVDRPLAPVLHTSSDGVVVAASGSTGWWRDGARSTVVDGQLGLPAGRGRAWYPGAAIVLAADLVALGVAVRCRPRSSGSRRRRRWLTDQAPRPSFPRSNG